MAYLYGMDLSLEKLSNKELLQLVLESKSRAEKQDLEIEKQNSEIQKSESKIKKKTAEVQNMELEVERLNHQLDMLRRMLFGSKSERFEIDTNQMKIEFEEYATDEQKQDENQVKDIVDLEVKKKSKKHKGRNRIPDNLPVVEYTIEPKEDISGMKKIGEVRTQFIEHLPGKFINVVLIRPKYAKTVKSQDLSLHPKSSNVVIAELPSRPIEKCLAGNYLLVSILISKYVDHLPLYRQRHIFKRYDIDIASSTIDSWVVQLAKLLEPLYDRLVSEIKAQTYLQADESTIKVLDDIKKGKTHLGYYWGYYAPLCKLTAFDYQKGRGKDAPRGFLLGYQGVLQTDGYAVYKNYYNNDKVTHLACWAHARRKFEKSASNDKNRSDHAMLEIQKLYAIEREIKEFSPEERKKVRLEKSLPILNDFGKWLHKERQQTLPSTPIGEAINYTTKLWDSLLNYLHDGNLKIDNNPIENNIRPIALGRKNYLFAGSHIGAQRSAMFYSFFASCKNNNVNPQKWLTYILENIADYKANKLHELLPNNIDPAKIENFKQFWEV